MPEMNFPDGAHYNHTLAWVYMFFPEDEEQRLKFLSGIETASAVLPVATGRADASSLSDEHRRSLALGPNILETYNDAFLAVDEYGFVSGVILLLVLTLATHAPEVASVNRAIDLILFRMKAKKVTREHLMRRWAAYKSVSHFYAAYLVDGGYKLESKRAFGTKGIEVVTELADAARLAAEAVYETTSELSSSDDPGRFATIMEAGLHWLAIAEALRQKACSTYPLGQPGRKHTLLNSEKTWTAPASFNLPRVPFSLRRLDHAEMEFLLGTRARTFVN